VRDIGIYYSLRKYNGLVDRLLNELLRVRISDVISACAKQFMQKVLCAFLLEIREDLTHFP